MENTCLACAFLFAFFFSGTEKNCWRFPKSWYPQLHQKDDQDENIEMLKIKIKGIDYLAPNCRLHLQMKPWMSFFFKRKVFFAMFIFGIGFRTIISFCVGPIQNEWISLSLRRIYPKVKFGNACSKNASHGSGLKMVKAFVMVDRSHSGSIVPPPHALHFQRYPKVSKGWVICLPFALPWFVAMVVLSPWWSNQETVWTFFARSLSNYFGRSFLIWAMVTVYLSSAKDFREYKAAFSEVQVKRPSM